MVIRHSAADLIILQNQPTVDQPAAAKLCVLVHVRFAHCALSSVFDLTSETPFPRSEPKGSSAGYFVTSRMSKLMLTPSRNPSGCSLKLRSPGKGFLQKTYAATRKVVSQPLTRVKCCEMLSLPNEAICQWSFLKEVL